jgi:hypothetical protein
LAFQSSAPSFGGMKAFMFLILHSLDELFEVESFFASGHTLSSQHLELELWSRVKHLSVVQILVPNFGGPKTFLFPALQGLVMIIGKRRARKLLALLMFSKLGSSFLGTIPFQLWSSNVKNKKNKLKAKKVSFGLQC